MGSSPIAVSDLILHLDPSSDIPIYLQLYEELRCGIVDRCCLPPGAKLPSTRALADSLCISRNTVLAAFEQLLAEGYLEGRTGSGTYVARCLPDSLLGPGSTTSVLLRERGPARVSRRGERMRKMRIASNSSVLTNPTKPRPFRMHTPALDTFPYDTWGRLLQRSWDRIRPEMLGYGSPAGLRELREGIAQYLRAARAVHCDWRQVIITSGAKQAMNLVSQMMLDPGDAVFVENPCFYGIRAAFSLAGADIVPVHVDEEGIDISRGEMERPDARIAYVTPSHQYPLGVTMSLRRRLALLDWARRNDGWIIEDDYDSEFRYRGRPLSSLEGLDKEGRVLYIGTMSKVMLPSLRIGYIIVPEDLVDTFVAARAHFDVSSPVLEQAVLAEFIREGHFGRHIRRMRSLYEQRQQMLVEAVRRNLRGLLDVPAKESGMHLLGWLPEGVDDVDASAALAESGVESTPLSVFATPALTRGGLLLGYAPFDEREINAAVERMTSVLERKMALSAHG